MTIFRRVLPPATLVVLAFAVRLVATFVRGGSGPGGVYGYDAGVYYAAADSLLQGDLPYRDFVLLHPPGLPLVLTPFAVLGRLTSDHTGYVVANLAFMLLGGVNAALVYGVARRLGTGPLAAWLGGAFYAVWFSAVLAEVSLRLEPLAAFAALLGAFLLARPERGRRASFAGGALMTFAACVKIWWAVPVLVLLVVLVRVDRRAVRPYLAGAAAAVVIVVLPFFAAAPGDMWRMVVLDQFGRPDGGAVGKRRFATVMTLRTADIVGTGATIGIVLVTVLTVLLVALAARTPAGRIVAVVFAVQMATLFLSPTYFSFYGGYVAPVAGVLVAVSGVRLGRREVQVPAAVALVSVAALTIASLVATRPLSRPFPRTPLASAVADARCVGTDSPIVLIQLNVLTRNLRNGCPNWVDVSGHSYDTSESHRGVPRRRNAQWQADLLAYLRGNDVVLVIRPGTEPSAQTRHVIDQWPVRRTAGGVKVRVVPRSGR